MSEGEVLFWGILPKLFIKNEKVMVLCKGDVWFGIGKFVEVEGGTLSNWLFTNWPLLLFNNGEVSGILVEVERGGISITKGLL